MKSKSQKDLSATCWSLARRCGLRRGCRRGEFPCGTEKVRIFKQPDNIFAVNMCQIDEPFDVNDPDLVTKAAIACKTGVSAKNVSYADLKKALLDQGAYLG